MMSLNRYKLKHQADEGNKSAKRAHHLLKRPDRLIGTILLGNNFVNIAATSLGTVIGIRLYGDLGVLYATITLTIVVLIFSEVAPKTYAALHAPRIALPVAGILAGLVHLFSPLVALVNLIVRLILRPLGIKTDNAVEEALSNEELKRASSSPAGTTPKAANSRTCCSAFSNSKTSPSAKQWCRATNSKVWTSTTTGTTSCSKSPPAGMVASSLTATTSIRSKACCTSATSSCSCVTTPSTAPPCDKRYAPASSCRRARRYANNCCNSAVPKRVAASWWTNTATSRASSPCKTSSPISSATLATKIPRTNRRKSSNNKKTSTPSKAASRCAN
ncbi:hypothetical protein HMPREF9080_01137 [Cardiobacterium valvarum F0432]|uniref:CNNM transmembrane domain-containing protein n=1 Tax=Cardiobacterium valvarum F0432 TaxID=797473 RepID=G9ZEF2_9GAMM|nr:hypothetical protein HMPREF9080_01137 [Cardiobacterium valvarum F0432]